MGTPHGLGPPPLPDSSVIHAVTNIATHFVFVLLHRKRESEKINSATDTRDTHCMQRLIHRQIGESIFSIQKRGEKKRDWFQISGRNSSSSSSSSSSCGKRVGVLAWSESKERAIEREMGEEVPVVRTTGNLNAGGLDVMTPSSADADSLPDHLVVMIHGILGSSGDWEYAANQFAKQLPHKVLIHCSERNMHRLSLRGVDVMGERLAEEVLEVIGERPEIKKISFIAHSIGGLVARYAIARLYRPRTGNICGLEPINFIAVATPHLGSRGNKHVPLLLGLNRMENLASKIIHWLLGRAGKHLFLTDTEEGKPPLLLRMITDSSNLPFISALRSFNRRVAYANVDCDQVVGWRTSSIRRKDELPQLDSCINEKYPHVVHEEFVEAKDDDTCEDLTSDADLETMEEKMVKGLSRVSWEKVDVSFHKSLQWLVAHSIIQVKFSFMYEGADVIQHMIDHFHT